MDIDVATLELALFGLDQKRLDLTRQIAELRRHPVAAPAASAASDTDRGTHQKRHVSAAGRRKIALAQQKRWESSRANAQSPTPAPVPTAKREISAAARRNMAIAQKRRWAAKKVADAQAKAAPRPVVAAKAKPHKPAAKTAGASS